MPKTKGFAPPLISPETLKERLLKAVSLKEIDLFWELNARYKNKYGRPLTERAMTLLIDELSSSNKELFAWLIDRSHTIPVLDDDGEIKGYYLTKP